MESILNKLASYQLSTCASIIAMFTYTILLDRDFACTCQSQVRDCALYMILPFFIVFFLTLWTNTVFLKVCRYTCARCYSIKGCCFLFYALPKVLDALSVGLLWVVFVLIDGDWYVCCHNDHSDGQVVLACKAAAKITEKEQVMISELKNKSRIIGGGLLLGIVIVGILFKYCLRNGCSRKSECKSEWCSRKFVYDNLILEEEGKVLEEVLRKSAHEELSNKVRIKIRGDHWEDCFDVAEEMIKNSTPPVVHEQTERRAAEDQELERPPQSLRLEEQINQEEEEHSI